MENTKIITLVVAYEAIKEFHVDKCIIPFRVDMDSVQSTIYKSTNKVCYIAYGQYNNEGYWISSNTSDMRDCFSISKEGGKTIYECNNIRCV